jgi:uncharacterized Tic20 family protein
MRRGRRARWPIWIWRIKRELRYVNIRGRQEVYSTIAVTLLIIVAATTSAAVTSVRRMG